MLPLIDRLIDELMGKRASLLVQLSDTNAQIQQLQTIRTTIEAMSPEEVLALRQLIKLTKD